MNRYLDIDPWKVVETGFHPEHQRSSESIFSIGNGRFGQRANHEEQYGGDSLRGSYVGGVYYPDKTKVGWWNCLLYTSPSPRDVEESRMPSSA